MMKGPWYIKFWWLIKVAFFLLSCWFIYFHLKQQLHTLGDTWNGLKSLLAENHRIQLYTVLLLALFNWSLEVFKWQLLVKKVEHVPLFRAFRAVFNGITVSFFTPNRSGEFAGRIIYLQPGNRIKAALLSLVGSTAQLLVTFQCGLAALWYYLPLFVDMEQTELLKWQLLILITFVLLSLSWWKLPRLSNVISRLKIRNTWKEKAQVWSRCSSTDKGLVWLLSLSRYIVFTLQQVLIFRILDFSPSLPEMAGLSALSFMLITAIPSIALGELGIRGSVNLAVFGFAGALSSTVILATFTLWCLNLAIPASMGAVSVLFLKWRMKENS